MHCMLPSDFHTDRHVVLVHLNKASGNLDFRRLFPNAFYTSCTEAGDNRSMVVENFKRTFFSGDGDTFKLTAEERPFGGDNLYLNGSFHSVCGVNFRILHGEGEQAPYAIPPSPKHYAWAAPRIFLPLAMASSIVPTLRNACSGR